MAQARDGGRRVNLGGLVVAGVGFFLTRFTVSLAVYDEPLAFLLVGVVPLAAGLAVAAFGVALAVGAFEGWYARSVAVWCVAGTASMGVLVALTLVGTEPAFDPGLMTVRTKTYLSNFLIGGCVGGTFTGVYAARNRRKRLGEERQAKRMVVLNRVFRDRVLNAITAIRGHVDVLSDDGADNTTRDRAYDVVDEQADELADTVVEIRHLTRSAGGEEAPLEPVDVAAAAAASVERAREWFPEADVSFDVSGPDEQLVWANDLLGRTIDRLVENAVLHNDAATPSVAVSVRRHGRTVSVTVEDDGPGLPDAQREMLADGSVAEFDDPSVGFGLNVVALVVDSYGGSIRSAVDDGTAVTIDLGAVDEGTRRAGAVGPRATGASRAQLALAGGAALFAGLLMGVVGNYLTGLIPVIGVLYGVENALVGWVTHEFHSVVFGVVYVGLLGVAPRRYRSSHQGRIGIAILWGVALWLLAVGLVTPLWLRLLGLSAPVPNLSPSALATHLVWAATLGVTYSVGVDSLPRLRDAFDDRPLAF